MILELFTPYFVNLSQELQSTIIGGLIALAWVILWVILSKISELIQFTNRQEKRSSWPKYKLISNYIYGSTEHYGIGEWQETLDISAYTQDLIESGWRYIKINWGKNIQTAEIQLPDRKEKYLILNLKKFDPDKDFIFFIQVKYMCDWFYYTDFWRWRLILKNHGYQIKFYPPVGYFWYIIQILKSYFKRRKLHPWED